MKSYFINEAIDNAINNYLNSKDNPEGILYNSFLVVVIRLLINIYGELDIINPYQVKNEDALDTNLMKYGATKDEINELKRLINEYYIIDLKNKSKKIKETNKYFIDIQKKIIDLFNLKRLSQESVDNKAFFDLLYTPGCSSPLRISYNYLSCSNTYEVAEYYKEVTSQNIEIKKDTKKNLLGFDVYEAFNISIAKLSQMSESEIDELNKRIYKYFNIPMNAINKEYQLQEKINNVKRLQEVNAQSNGFVDILIIIGIIVIVVTAISIAIALLS